jgi:hypothetical protein
VNVKVGVRLGAGVILFVIARPVVAETEQEVVVEEGGWWMWKVVVCSAAPSLGRWTPLRP